MYTLNPYMNILSAEQLNKLTTKRLYSLYKSFRWYIFKNHNEIEEGYYTLLPYERDLLNELEMYREQIKSILATREHIERKK
jgi:hypothetical protein